MKDLRRFLLLGLVLAAPGIMAAAPERSSDSIGVYGGAGRYQTGGCNSELRAFNEVSASYKHTFTDGKMGVGLHGGFVETKHERWVDQPAPGYGDNRLPYERAYYLNPYFSYNPWRYFGFDAGVLGVQSPDTGRALYEDLAPNIGGKVWPSLALRAGLLDKVYLSVRAFSGGNVMVSNYFFGADVVLTNVIPMLDLSAGVSAFPEAPLVPQATLRFRAGDHVSIPIMAKYRPPDEHNLGDWGFGGGLEVTF